MLPHKHFLVSALLIIIAIIIFFPWMESAEVIKWIVVGGFISAAIDLDIYTIVCLKSRKENKLKPYRNPMEIYRSFNVFMDTIFATGVDKIGLITHLVFPTFIILIFYFLFAGYFIPVIIGVVSHIISDLPNFKRLKL